MQEDADGVEAELVRGPAEFAVDRGRVEGVGLPHFQLVDGGAGDKVAADQPGLLGVPKVGLLGGPARQFLLLGGFVGTLWLVIGTMRDVSNVARPVSLHQVTAIVAERHHHQIGAQDQPGRERQAQAKGTRAKPERGEIGESGQFVKRHDGAISEHAGEQGGDEAAGGGR